MKTAKEKIIEVLKGAFSSLNLPEALYSEIADKILPIQQEGVTDDEIEDSISGMIQPHAITLERGIKATGDVVEYIQLHFQQSTNKEE